MDLSAKTNWKFLAIVIALVVIVGGGVLLSLQDESANLPKLDIQNEAKNEIKIGQVEINYNLISGIQSSVDEGHQPWRLNPIMVLRAEIAQYGFDPEKDLETLDTPDTSIQAEFGKSINEFSTDVKHEDKTYVVTLIQPIPGEGKIWTISEVELKTAETINWQTYRNEDFGFEVKFPSVLVLQKNTGEAYTSFLGKLTGESYFLQFGYISQSTLDARGISYCEAYPNDSRCERFTFDNVEFLIDWDIETEGALTRSRAEILKSEGGMVVIDILHSPSRDVKSFFRQILSTFRFIESEGMQDRQTEVQTLSQETNNVKKQNSQEEEREPVVTQIEEPMVFIVKPYLVYPADKAMIPLYETAVQGYLAELRQWYFDQVGATFQMVPLEVIRHPFRNYLEMRCGENPRQECINNLSLFEGNWAQYMNEAIYGGAAAYYAGGPCWAADTAYLVFGAGGGGYAGANSDGNSCGWAVVSDWVLEPISGVPNEWGIPCVYSSGWQCGGGVPKGTPAHELGHAFGLPHPGEQYADQSIRQWHGNYPGVGLLPQEIEFLRDSPFFNL
ncbi:MAG: hypothetical protein A3G10_00630 [Candidatus Wildermuthbacteria bacterium RIFCSPLOWO2_12_FULL_49_9]|nr:MAG: hypothetical protein A3G10_00630 [Candidatus Wildermuthbacteria bacterium RIFCSPLOWO2_12_FULL_49_9]